MPKYSNKQIIIVNNNRVPKVAHGTRVPEVVHDTKRVNIQISTIQDIAEVAFITCGHH